MDVTITFDSYQTAAYRTAKRFEHKAGDLNHACLGIVTEWFEFKFATDDANRLEEAADLMWYVALAATTLEVKLSEITGTNYVNTYQIASMKGVDVDTVLDRSVDRAIGAFATAVKRIAIYDKPLDMGMTEALVQNLSEIVLGLARICESRELVLVQGLRENIAKLRKRFPDKYSNEAAEARADKGGLDATVS